jgi:hypothetical protein
MVLLVNRYIVSETLSAPGMSVCVLISDGRSFTGITNTTLKTEPRCGWTTAWTDYLELG